MHGATRPDQCKDAKHGEADPLGRGADAGTRYVHPRMRMLVHISHVSRPHTDVNPRPQWPRPHVATPLFRHTTHACRSPMGSSTENLVAAVACRHPIILAHFSHVSRTHRQHHRRPPVATVAWRLHRRYEWLRLAPPPNPSGHCRMAPPHEFDAFQ